jgi:predicted nucleotidyltransferase
MAVSKSLDDLLTAQERQAVDTFVKALYQQYPKRIRDVILYGSKARGDSHPDSDIDILILVDDDDWRFSHAISKLAARISLNYDVLLGPRVISQSRWPRSILYRTVSAEGISLSLAHQGEPGHPKPF